ncbi:hypothetical protein L198_02153 [Cryptococcus wingfieldii CBS 7118]|uniref:Uncharacterized protein n=1 Tax=Cryptococcus wingfieldii CBS 7118 TaxID=1295528 RepID=A0A1E3JR06_9TREE|nr:hypothetical protein L198_02153 [Cryptococcus wingfieldii CBS 7118]ODO03309.1 hypothetical protein L198_02153 [Cryptococcus wingfieldii CBS 7118]
MDDPSLDGPASLVRALAAWAEEDEQLQDTLMRSSPIQPVVEEDEDEDDEDEVTPSPADFREFQGDAGLGRRSKKRGQSGVAPTQNSQLKVEGGMSQPGVVKKRGRPKTSKKRKQPDGTLAPLGEDELLPAARSKKCKYFGRAVGEEPEVPRDDTDWRDWE